MPRELLTLRTFTAGLMTNPDKEDIPNEAQTGLSANLDPNYAGKLAGRLSYDITHETLGVNGEIFGWLHRAHDDKWDLIYGNGTGTYIIKDFYSPSATQVVADSGDSPSTIVVGNQEAHVGYGADQAAKWIGYVGHNQFSSTNPYRTTPTLVIEDAEPTQPTGQNSTSLVSATASTEENATFIKGWEHEYKISFVYDGYQESPLGGVTFKYQVISDIESVVGKVTIDSYENISERITGVRVYRRSRPFFDSADWDDYQQYLDVISQLGLDSEAKGSADDIVRYRSGTLGEPSSYKLIADIDINDSSWTEDGADMEINFTDTNSPGVSYEANVGIAEDNVNTNVYYGLDYELGIQFGRYMFVANATHPRLPAEDESHMLFRSKPARFDTFDWVNDILYLPTKPTAMAGHREKLYVWDENNTYVVNPELMVIEKVIEGRGCSSQQSVVNTDYGLYWANKNGVYWSTITDELIKPVKDNLTEPIRSDYQTAAASATPWLVYNSKTGQLLVRFVRHSYAYHLAQQRWDYYSYDTTNQRTGTFSGKNGETYSVTDNIGVSAAIIEDYAGANRVTWTFYSKEFTFDTPGQTKVFYELVSDSSGTAILYYSIDGGTTFRTLTDSVNIQDASGDWERANSIIISVIGTSNTITDSISLIYRRMRGLR